MIAWGPLVAGGLLICAALVLEPLPPLPLLGGFLLLCLGAEYLIITLPQAGTVAFGPAASLPAALVLGSGYAGLCAGVAQLAVNMQRRRPVATIVFNSSQRALSVALAGAIWNLIQSGRLSLALEHTFWQPDRVLPAALGSVAVYAVTTHVVVSFYSAMRREVPVTTVLLGNASIRLATTWVLGSFGVLATIELLRIRTMPPNLQFVLVIPIVGGLVFLAYDSHGQQNRHLRRLYAAVTDLVQAADLAQLLDRLAGLVARVATPSALWVSLRNADGAFDVAVSRGLDPETAQGLADTVTAEMWGRQPDASVHLARETDRMRTHRLPLKAAGQPVRSVMLVPLVTGTHLMGSLGMVHSIPDYFIPAQERAVAMLASQAAFVVNYLRLYGESQRNLARAEALQARNADLLRESERRAHQLTLLNRSFTRVSTSLATDEVFGALVDELHDTLGYPFVSLQLLEGDVLRLVTRRGYEGREDLFPISRGIIGRVARTGQCALVLDVHSDPDYVASDARVTQQVSVPIMHRGVVVGVITVETIEPVLGTTDLELLTTLAGYAAVAIDNARHYEEARTLAMTDGLTGLANRRMLWEALERELARANRTGAPLSVVMLEVDRFKHFNDTYGHLLGDFALQQVARVLNQEHRAHVDVVARYGGDEFVALLPGTPKAGATALAERIRRLVGGASSKRSPADTGAVPGPLITVSLGVASFPEDGRTIETLIRAADRAMYTVKAAGGDAVAIASEAGVRAAERLHHETPPRAEPSVRPRVHED